MDRCIKGGGYAVRRPSRGPSDDEVRTLINMQQEGEIQQDDHTNATTADSLVRLSTKAEPIPCIDGETYSP